MLGSKAELPKKVLLGLGVLKARIEFYEFRNQSLFDDYRRNRIYLIII